MRRHRIVAKNNYVDVAAITQVIGCVLNNSTILDNTDEYSITEKDFVEDFHKIVFGSMYNLHLNNSKVTIDAIIDYLANRPKFNAIFQQNKGIEYLVEASELANIDTFNYYYNRLKKFSLLRAYDNYGVDVSFLYDPTNILDAKKKQEQEDWIDQATLLDIAKAVDLRIDTIRGEFAEDDLGMAYQAGDGINELIADLQKHPEIGIPLYGPLINTVTRGARLRKLYLRSAATGTGKAIPNDTLIPTPTGYRKVADIQVGDYLFSRTGQPTRVIGVHPQSEKKQVYEITFSDGRKAKCCKEHLWSYYYYGHRGWEMRTESLMELLKRSKGEMSKPSGGYKYRLPLNQAVEYPSKQFSVPPYVMGALLGDGSFRYASNQKALTFSTADVELVETISKLIGCSYHKNSEFNYNYTFKLPEGSAHTNLWVEELLFQYPELWNIKSEDKFIPQDYLMGSINQRKELLRGLMDTDGSINSSGGRTSFTTISAKLRDDVIELCHSLGYICTYSTDKRQEKYTTGICYEIHIQAPKEEKVQMFKLSRKVKIAIDYLNNNKRAETKSYIAFDNIKALDEYVDMTCFTVANDEHLFLMNDYIVTHNTRSMIADACNFACDRIYHNDWGWITNGLKQPTLFIATEQDKSEVQTMMLSFLSNVNETHILDGRYEDDELERVKEAARILQNSPLWIEELPDFSLQDVENKIKRHIRDNGVKYVAFDYLQTSLKILEEITHKSGGVRLREDNILFMLSARLKDLANKYGIFILTATQLNSSYQDSETPDQNLLRGAKSIADRADLGMILLTPTNDDLVKIEGIVAGNPHFRMPNIKLSVYKNRRGAYKGIYLWCAADLGTCRIEPQFCTDWRHQLLPIEDIKVIVEDDPAPWETTHKF